MLTFKRYLQKYHTFVGYALIKVESAKFPRDKYRNQNYGAWEISIRHALLQSLAARFTGLAVVGPLNINNTWYSSHSPLRCFSVHSPGDGPRSDGWLPCRIWGITGNHSAGICCLISFDNEKRNLSSDDSFNTSIPLITENRFVYLWVSLAMHIHPGRDGMMQDEWLENRINSVTAKTFNIVFIISFRCESCSKVWSLL